MDKKTKTYLVIFVSLILAIVFYEYSKPIPINWFPSYAKKDKIPLGAFVLRTELDAIFFNAEVKDVKIPPFVFLEDSTIVGTYIFINDQILFDKAEIKRLLNFVEKGNDVFVSSNGHLLDTLNIETEELLTSNLKEKPFFKLINKNFPNIEYSYDRKFRNQVFTKIDTLRTTVLGITGYLDEDDERTEEGVNFIKHQHGKGNFYLHTFPEAFTNYGILNVNNLHATNVLSYLKNDGIIYWDEYYKTGKKRISSPLHYLLSSPNLKWAYYTVLIGILLFVIFEGKRKQRFIPIVTPLKNQTLAFSRTIANMYYEKSEHKNIAEHRIDYLLNFIRLKLRIPTYKIDTTFHKYVASRSGKSENEIKILFDYCNQVHIKNTITKEELLKLNTLIEEFKSSIK
ncbi:MAG: DUF4350 domain-containing protein [Flavobacteriaceae bacterium]